MDAVKSIDSLTWSDELFTLHDFLEQFGLPNLIRSQKGYYDLDGHFTFVESLIFMLHGLHTEHNLVAEDSNGRPLSLPLYSECSVLLCPLPTYFRHDSIQVSQMPFAYPTIKYFRVLENPKNERLDCLKPKSILEIEYVDSDNFSVKFKNVEQPLSKYCRVVFEPLLDNREYTLKKAVQLFGLPAKVRLLSSRSGNQRLDNEFESFISNLGKVTLSHRAEAKTVIVATEIGAYSVGMTETFTSVKCCQIPRDVWDVHVGVAKGLLTNDPTYTDVVRKLNQAFLEKYNIKDLQRCRYLDQRGNNTTRIITSVLRAVPKAVKSPQKLLASTPAKVAFPRPSLSPRHSRRVGKPSLDSKPMEQHDQWKHTNGNENSLFLTQYNMSVAGLKQGKKCAKDYHVYESISDDEHENEDESKNVTSKENARISSKVTLQRGLHYAVSDLICGSEQVAKSDRKAALTLPIPTGKSTDNFNATHARDSRPKQVDSVAEGRLDENIEENYVITLPEKNSRVPSPVDLASVKLKPINKNSITKPVALQADRNGSQEGFVVSTNRAEANLKPHNPSSSKTLELQGSKTVKSEAATQAMQKVSAFVSKPGDHEPKTICSEPRDSAGKNGVVVSLPAAPIRVGGDCGNWHVSAKADAWENLRKHVKNVAERLDGNYVTILPNIDAYDHLNAPAGRADEGLKPNDLNSSKTLELQAGVTSRTHNILKNNASCVSSKSGSPNSAGALRAKSVDQAVEKVAALVSKPDGGHDPKTIGLERHNVLVQKRASRNDFIPNCSRENVKSTMPVPAGKKTIHKTNHTTLIQETSEKLSPDGDPNSRKLVSIGEKSSPPTRPNPPILTTVLHTPPTVPIARRLSSLSVEGVVRLLGTLNMACYAKTFLQEQIDGEILVELDEAVLKSFGMKMFHVKKLIKVIEGWRPRLHCSPTS